MVKTVFARIWMLAVMLSVSLGVMSQTFHEDHAVDYQFMTQEVGSGSSCPTTLEGYYTLHKDYRNSMLSTNKMLLRSSFKLVLVQEEPVSEHVDSALHERLRVEELNIADHMPSVTDLAYQVEKKKIEGKLEVFRSNIDRITSSGGSFRDYKNWIERYNAISKGLQAVRDAYMPQGKRKEEYICIYRDVIRKNSELTEFLTFLRNMKNVSGAPAGAAVPHAHVASIASGALQFWKNAFLPNSTTTGKEGRGDN